MNVLKQAKDQSQKARTGGFTIIEVVLVLAIAGLIFLMVFIALPALQASQRDTARKADVGSVASAITEYTGNNRGTFPSTTTLTGNATGTPTGDKFAGYITSVSNNTTSVIVIGATKTTQPVKQGEVFVVKASKCGATGAATNGVASQGITPGASRQFVVVTYLEAGSGTSYCQES